MGMCAYGGGGWFTGRKGLTCLHVRKCDLTEPVMLLMPNTE